MASLGRDGYGTSDVGEVFRALVLQGYEDPAGRSPANLLFCIDEIDKMSSSRHHGRAEDLLLQLLEKRTAARFRDECAREIRLRAEHINWIFTANDTEGLSEPLLSRVVVIDVPPLTSEQSRKVAQRIYQEQASRIAAVVSDVPALPDSELNKLVDQSPRRMQQLLRLGIGRALAQSQKTIWIDLPRCERARFGFC